MHHTTAPAVLLAPAAAWRPDGWVLAACVYSGVFATGLNNVLLARVTRRLGPTVANLYMPLQPATTVLIDYLTLGDAVYLATVLCSVGVVAGLVLAVLGKQRSGASVLGKQRSGASVLLPEAAQQAEERAGLLQLTSARAEDSSSDDAVR